MSARDTTCRPEILMTSPRPIRLVPPAGARKFSLYSEVTTSPTWEAAAQQHALSAMNPMTAPWTKRWCCNSLSVIGTISVTLPEPNSTMLAPSKEANGVLRMTASMVSRDTPPGLASVGRVSTSCRAIDFLRLARTGAPGAASAHWPYADYRGGPFACGSCRGTVVG